MSKDKDKRGLMYNLGAFFGGIAHGVKTDPAAKKPIARVTREEETRESPEGRVKLRRTTIEEIEIEPNDRS